MAKLTLLDKVSIGDRFGRLVVTEKIPAPKQGKPRLRCQCDCGEIVSPQMNNVLLGHTKSCGCLHRELSSERERTHGRKHTTEYNIWNGIKQRCYNENHTHYDRYGGRGIAMCERWRGSFENFLSDVGLRPNMNVTLDRKNGDGNYEPGNVRWATQSEQMRNTRRTVLIESNGSKISAKEYATLHGVEYETFMWRVRAGWSIDRIINTPSGRSKLKGRKRDG